MGTKKQFRSPKAKRSTFEDTEETFDMYDDELYLDDDFADLDEFESRSYSSKARAPGWRRLEQLREQRQLEMEMADFDNYDFDADYDFDFRDSGRKRKKHRERAHA